MCSGVWPGVCTTSMRILPTIHAVAVMNGDHIGLVCVGILPIRSAHFAQVDHGACVFAKLTAAADEIGVDVRLGHVRDAQTLLFRRLQIGTDVAGGVDDEGFAGLRATDHVRRLG